MEGDGERVAIVGAGPSGLAAARYLKAHGFAPIIFEQSQRVGGQWNAGAELSGIWPGLRANTSRVVTRFSDLDYPAETEAFPASGDVLAYLERYAETFALGPHLRLGTRVETVARHPSGGWAVHSRSPGRSPRTEIFGRVVVASGRFTDPRRPEIAGISGFAGAGGVSHSFDYSGPEAFRGMRVLVAGCSISALEIASELAAAGVEVVSAMRRQRYVVKRVVDGIPVDNLAITRFGALAAECLPHEAVAAELRDFVLRSSGDPAACGGLVPSADPFEAGLALSQDYLDHLQAGRIVAHRWMECIDGRELHFEDGGSDSFDALILATGYRPDLAFLDGRTRRILGVENGGPDLAGFTFHPDLPGLAFLGMFDLSAPYFPVLEIQARWLTYVWAGLAEAPTAAAMRADLARADRPGGHATRPLMQEMAIGFARKAGVEPDAAAWPELARALLFGPLSAVSFRLSGPDALPGIGPEVMAEAARLGAIASPVFTEAERERIAALVAAGRAELAALLENPAAAAKPQRQAA